jgi:hypothetical protein
VEAAEAEAEVSVVDSEAVEAREAHQEEEEAHRAEVDLEDVEDHPCEEEVE